MAQIRPYTIESKNTVLSRLSDVKENIKTKHLIDYFKEDSNRFKTFSVKLEPLIFDYSKQRIDSSLLNHLVDWANVSELKP